MSNVFVYNEKNIIFQTTQVTQPIFNKFGKKTK